MYPWAANFLASTWTLVTSGQVASIVRSSRCSAFACTDGATPWAEKTTVSPSGTSVSWSTKTAPRGAARSSFSGAAVGIGLEASEQLAHRFAAHVEALPGYGAQVVAGLVPAGEVEVDQVDRGDSAIQERDVVVGDGALGVIREVAGGADPPGSGAELAPELDVRVRLARDPQALVRDEVEQDHRLGLAVGARGHLGAAQPARLEVPVVRRAGRLLAVEGDPQDRRTDRARSDAARELDQRGGAAGTVVGADEAVDLLGVVVGAHHHRAFWFATRRRPDHVAQPARHRLVAAARESLPDLSRELARRRRSRGTLPQRDLALEPGPCAVLVEAIDLARGGRFGLRILVAAELPGGDQQQQSGGDGDLHHEDDHERAHADKCADRLNAWPLGTRTASPPSTRRSSRRSTRRRTCTSARSRSSRARRRATTSSSRASSRGSTWSRGTARSWPSRALRWAARSGSTTRASTSTTTCATRRCRNRERSISCGI